MPPAVSETKVDPRVLAHQPLDLGLVVEDVARACDACVSWHSVMPDRPTGLQAYRRAPVELAAADLLHRDRRAADPARLAGALVDPVLGFGAGGLVVHRDTSGRSRRRSQQLHPVAPELAHDLFAHLAPGRERVLPRPEQHLGPVDVADAADDRLVHQQQGDRGRLLADGRDEDAPRPRARSSTSGSGPSLAMIACTSSVVCTSQAVGPRRSATAVGVSSRTRTCPIGSGGKASRSSPTFSCSDMRSRVRRGAPIDDERTPRPSPPIADRCRPRSPTRRTGRGARAASRSSSNSRNICLPTAFDCTMRVAVELRGVAGEPALRRRHRDRDVRGSAARTGARCGGRSGPRARLSRSRGRRSRPSSRTRRAGRCGARGAPRPRTAWR